MRQKAFGFTLAELLSALAILGVIATFTIPKVLNSSSSQKHKAVVKEIASAVVGAYSAYRLNNTVTSSINLDSLTPYLNYIRVHTGLVDQENLGASADCSLAQYVCLKFANNAVMRYTPGLDLTLCPNQDPSVMMLYFEVDPDGVYGGSTTGISKSTEFYLYLNGRLTSRPYINVGVDCNQGVIGSSAPNADPEYFSW